MQTEITTRAKIPTNIEKMFQRIDKKERNPSRYCHIKDDQFIRWSHKDTLQEVIHGMVRYIEILQDENKTLTAQAQGE